MLKATDYQHISKKIYANEASRKLPPEALEFIYANKLFKFFVPEKANGKGFNMRQALDCLVEVAKIDGNLGWLLSTGSGASYFYGFMKPNIANEVYHHKKSVIAGSGHPSGVAVIQGAGYLVNGTWKYCSGADIATNFTFNCKIDGKEDQIKAFIFQPDQVTIHHDWDGFGLKSTYTHTVEIKDIFIPSEYTFDIMSTPQHPHPIYRVPFLPFAQASIVAVGVGIAEAMLKETQEIAESNKHIWQSGDKDRYSFICSKLQQVTDDLMHSKMDFLALIDEGYNMIGSEALIEPWQIEIDKMSKELSRKALQVGSTLVPYLGMTAIKEHSFINYLWRNLQTASQHVLITPFAE